MPSRDLYEVLGVDRSATPNEIKKAYRKLALRLHPDKNPNGDPAVFQEVNDAYSILSDTRKREIYDSHGYDGVRMYEQYYEQGPPGLFAAYIVAALILLILSFLVPLFVTLKVDGSVGWDWATVATPVWILDGFQILAILLLLTQIHERSQLILVLVVMFHYALLLFFQIALVGRMDGKNDWEWRKIFAPLLIFEALNLLTSMFTSLPKSVYDQKFIAGKAYVCGYFGYAIKHLLWPICRLATYTLMVEKLSGGTFHWSIVFIPLVFTTIVGGIMSIMNDKLTIERRERIDPDFDATEAARRAAGAWFGFFLSVAFMSAFFTMLILRLEGHQDLTAAIICIPIWVVYGLVFCCLPLALAGGQDPGAAPPGGEAGPSSSGYSGGGRPGDDGRTAHGDYENAPLLLGDGHEHAVNASTGRGGYNDSQEYVPQRHNYYPDDEYV